MKRRAGDPGRQEEKVVHGAGERDGRLDARLRLGEALDAGHAAEGEELDLRDVEAVSAGHEEVGEFMGEEQADEEEGRRPLPAQRRHGQDEGEERVDAHPHPGHPSQGQTRHYRPAAGPRYGAGSTATPPRRTSKWRCTAVACPVCPASAMRCPARTRSPSATSTRSLWA